MATNAEQKGRSGDALWRRESRTRHFRERAIKIVLAACAYVSVLTTFGIVFVLIFETIDFFQEVSIIGFVSAPPIQIYSWVSQPQPAFQVAAAAGIVILMLVLLLTNSVAIYLRNRYQRRA